MERSAVLSKTQEIFRDILDNEDIELTEDTTSNDIEEWDSLSHIQLVVSIEHEFDIRFLSDEMVKWNKVGDMINSIIEKI